MKIVTSDYNSHTMGKSLYRYIEIKMHNLIRKEEIKEVIIQGDFDRSKSHVSLFEKNDKLFNWKRPTAYKKDDETIVLSCYPGKEYVYHYACLVSTYFSLKSQNTKVTCLIPNSDLCEKEIKKSNLRNMGSADVVILGYVEQLSEYVSNDEWQGDNGDFMWKKIKSNGKIISFLGCKHSY